MQVNYLRHFLLFSLKKKEVIFNTKQQKEFYHTLLLRPSNQPNILQGKLQRIQLPIDFWNI